MSDLFLCLDTVDADGAGGDPRRRRRRPLRRARPPPSATRATCCRCARRRCARWGSRRRSWPASPAAAARAASPACASGWRWPRGWRCRPAFRSTSCRRCEALALDILRRGARRRVTAVPCLDAGKGEVYVAGYVADGERAGARDRRRLPPRRGRARGLAGGAAAPRPRSPATAPMRYRAVAGARASRSPARPPSPSAAWRCCSARRGEAADLATRGPDLRPPARHHGQEDRRRVAPGRHQ